MYNNVRRDGKMQRWSLPLFHRGNNKRTLFALAAACICSILLFRSIFCEPSQTVYIVVLGMKPNQDGSLKPPLDARIKTAYQFYEKKKREVENDRKGGKVKVIVSGADVAKIGFTEAKVMSTGLKNAGIADSEIIKEDKAMNTIENALYAIQMIPIMKNGFKTSMIVVTSDFHVPRSRYLFECVLRGLGRLDISMEFAPSPDHISNNDLLDRLKFEMELQSKRMISALEKYGIKSDEASFRRAVTELQQGIKRMENFK